MDVQVGPVGLARLERLRAPWPRIQRDVANARCTLFSLHGFGRTWWPRRGSAATQ